MKIVHIVTEDVDDRGGGPGGGLGDWLGRVFGSFSSRIFNEQFEATNVALLCPIYR